MAPSPTATAPSANGPLGDGSSATPSPTRAAAAAASAAASALLAAARGGHGPGAASAPAADAPATAGGRSRAESVASEIIEPTGALTVHVSPSGGTHLSGVVLKRSTYLHLWKRRPVVLKGQGDELSLTFVKHNEESTIALGGRGVSVVPLDALRDRKTEREHGHGTIHPFSLVAGSGATLVMLACADKPNRDEWVRVLRLLLESSATLDDLAHGCVPPPPPVTLAAAASASATAAGAAKAMGAGAGASGSASASSRCGGGAAGGAGPGSLGGAIGGAPPATPPMGAGLGALPTASATAASAHAPRAALACAQAGGGGARSLAVSGRAPSCGDVPPAHSALPEPVLEAPDGSSERWRLDEVSDGVRLFYEEQGGGIGSLLGGERVAGGVAGGGLLRRRVLGVLGGGAGLAEAAASGVLALAVACVAVVCAVWGPTTGLSAALLALLIGLPASLLCSALLPLRPCHDAARTGCVRATTAVRASPEDVFNMVMGLGPARYEWDIAYDGGVVVDSLDRHSDVVYTRFPTLVFGPLLAQRRDACLLRYWRREAEGSYTVVSLSTTHRCCPLVGDAVRAEVRGSAITIRPAKRRVEDGAAAADAAGGAPGGAPCGAGAHCVVSHVLDLHPHGWIGANALLRRRYQRFAVANLRGLRYYAEQQQLEYAHDDEPLESEIGVSLARGLALASAEPEPAGVAEGGGAEAAGSPRAAAAGAGAAPSDRTMPPSPHLPAALSAASPLLRNTSTRTSARTSALAARRAPSSLPASVIERAGTLRRARHADDENCWDEPEPQTFKLRGATYLDDRVKVPATGAMMQLSAVDLLRSAHPLEHVAQRDGCAARLEAPSNYQLIVNFQLPGSPCLSLVLYFSVDRANPSDPALLARLEKFACSADEERNEIFKLIPSIEEGNWMVRRAVGKTPAIIGRALHTTYHTSPGQYVEVDIDVGSSSVATGVLRIVKGAARALVVDLALLLEGTTADELPEQLLGTARLMYVDEEHAAVSESATHAAER